MIKKILAAVLIASASTAVIAESDNVKTLTLNNQEVSPWSIDPASEAGFPWLSYIILTGEKPQTVIFYVNKYRKTNPELISDPVLIDCAGVPIMLNPGSSAVCAIGPNATGWYKGAMWGVEEKYRKNGSDGFTVTID